MPRWCRAMSNALQVRANEGSAAIIFCIVLPVLACVTVGAADYASVVSDRSTMQGIADRAALAAAAQLSVDTSSATAQRAQSYAQSQLRGLLGNWTTMVSSQVVNSGSAVQVTISGNKLP